MRKQFAPTSLELLADVLTIAKLYKSVLRWMRAVFNANGGKTRYQKKLLPISQVFMLF